MARRRIFPHLGWLMLSLAITAAIAGPGTYWLKPRLTRWVALRGLTSADLKVRERSLNYVIARGRRDPAVVAGTVKRLDVADQRNFVQMVNALELAGQWRRPTIPAGPWLRWLAVMASEKDPEARIVAAQRLGEAPDLADRPFGIELYQALAADPSENVRYNALVSAAATLGLTSDRIDLSRLLWRASQDPNDAIAREAWIMLGLRRPRRGFDPATLSVRPRVGEAAIWATAMIAGSDHQILSDALMDEENPPEIRAMAAYGLGVSPVPGGGEVLKAWMAEHAPALTEETQGLLWRAILAAPLEEQGARPDAIDRLLVRLATAPAGSRGAAAPAATGPTTAPATGPASRPRTSAGRGATPGREEALLRPLLIAAQFRHGLHKNQPLEPLLERDPVLAAAALAGATPDAMEIRPPAEAPDMIRLLAAAATANLDPMEIERLWASDVSAIRDHACVVAAQRLSPEKIEALIERGLKDFDDRVKMSAAILSGMTGAGQELLRRKTEDEDVWSVKQMMRVGLWMQDQLPEVEQGIAGMLTRADLPRSTLLLAMLHRGDKRVWEELLNPRGATPAGLYELLASRYWWPVLKMHLPGDAPPIWPWADRELAEFQIETLRNWWLMAHGASGMR